MRPNAVTARTLAAGAALTLAAAAGNAQVFQRLVGTPAPSQPQSLETTNDNGFISAGTHTTTANLSQWMVVKHAPNGRVQWDLQWGNQVREFAHAAVQTSDQGYIVAGNTSFNQNLTTGLLKLDPAGGVQWAFVYNGNIVSQNVPVAVRQDTVNPSYLAVTTERAVVGAAPTNGVLLRASLAGPGIFNLAYADAQFPENAFISFVDLRVLPNGDIVIVGSRDRPGSPNEAPRVRQILVGRFAPGGAPIWVNAYNFAAPLPNVTDDRGHGIELSANGDLLVSGQSTTTTAAGLVNNYVSYLRINPFNGAPLLSRRYPRLISPQAWRNIRERADGVVSIACTADPNVPAPINGPAALLALSPAGVPIFLRGYAPITGPFTGQPGVAAVPLNAAGPAGWGLLAWKNNANSYGGDDLMIAVTDPNGDTNCLDAPFATTIENPLLRVEDVALEIRQRNDWLAWPGPRAPLNARDVRFTCVGDYNWSCNIDFNDLNIVLGGFGGLYDFADLNFVLANFGNACP